MPRTNPASPRRSWTRGLAKRAGHCLLPGGRSSGTRGKGHRVLRRGIQGRTHAKPVRSVQPDCQVRPAHPAGRPSQPPAISPPVITPGLYSRLSGSGARTLLRRGLDPRKDQSYFLFSLRQDQLARTLFPLGQRTKTDTRAEARARNLKTADKQESMEICFVPDDDYGRFLEQAKLAQKHRGDIVDLDGRVLGQHQGIEFYTVGQRKGLGLSSPKPLYVVELDAARNRVVVGGESALARSEFQVERCNWIAFDSPPAPLEATVQIRYRYAGAPATVTPLEGGGARVQFHRPQRAITPAKPPSSTRMTLCWAEGGSGPEIGARRIQPALHETVVIRRAHFAGDEPACLRCVLPGELLFGRVPFEGQTGAERNRAQMTNARGTMAGLDIADGRFARADAVKEIAHVIRAAIEPLGVVRQRFCDAGPGRWP